MRRTAAVGLGLTLCAVVCPTATALAAASTTSTTATITTTTAGPQPPDDPVIAPPSSTTSTTAVPETAAGAHAVQAAVVNITTAGCASFCFSTAQTTVGAGGTVTFTNNSYIDHTVRRCTPSACNGASGGTGNDPTFSSVTLAVPNTKTASYTFTQRGTYVYYCTLHGYGVMHGTITVTAAVATTTTVALSPGVPVDTTTTVAEDPNALASAGGSMNGLIAVGALLLVAGLAAVGLSTRRRTER